MSDRPWTFWAMLAYMAGLWVWYIERWLTDAPDPGAWFSVVVVLPAMALWWLDSRHEAARRTKHDDMQLRAEVAAEVKRQLGSKRPPATIEAKGDPQ